MTGPPTSCWWSCWLSTGRATPCCPRRARTTSGRLSADRVWIVDPLDGTREFSEPPRDDWAVHVALWEDGELIAGAVAQPALGETFDTGTHPSYLRGPARRPRIAVSRTRPPAFVEALAAEIDAELGADGLGGVKVISVVRDVTDAYVHAGGQYEWDYAAPVAVARAAGLFMLARGRLARCATTRTTSPCPTWSSAASRTRPASSSSSPATEPCRTSRRRDCRRPPGRAGAASRRDPPRRTHPGRCCSPCS